MYYTTRRVLTLVVFILAVPALAAVLHQDTLSQDISPLFLQSWGNDVNVLRGPGAVAVGPELVYVGNAGNGRIEVYDHHGQPRGIFGESMFMFPIEYPSFTRFGLATDSDKYVYAVDYRANQVLKFTADGEYLDKFGEQGSGPGEFESPEDITVDIEGNIYVADEGNERIQKLASDGTFLHEWDVGSVVSVDTDAEGNVYAADAENSRILKYTSEGILITQWGRYGGGPGGFVRLRNITVDLAGYIYTTDSESNRVQRFSLDGDYIGEWGAEGTEPGKFIYPSGIDVDQYGKIYIGDSWNDRVQKFSADGKFLTKWGDSGKKLGEFLWPGPDSIAVSNSGHLLVIGTTYYGPSRVQLFTTDGAFQKLLGGTGRMPGQFDEPRDAAYADDGSIYVAECWGRIQKLNADGLYETEWGVAGCPLAIDVGDNGHVYVVDSTCIEEFTADGAYLNRWGCGTFGYPTGTVVDKNGYVYVADFDNNRIQKFTGDGVYVTGWGSKGTGPGQFDRVADLAIDANNNIYVSDLLNYRIQVFSTDGDYIGEWGSYGSGPGEFHSPSAIAIDQEGVIYVSESLNLPFDDFSP